jgi:hypothetical protein
MDRRSFLKTTAAVLSSVGIHATKKHVPKKLKRVVWETDKQIGVTFALPDGYNEKLARMVAITNELIEDSVISIGDCMNKKYARALR